MCSLKYLNNTRSAQEQPQVSVYYNITGIENGLKVKVRVSEGVLTLLVLVGYILLVPSLRVSSSLGLPVVGLSSLNRMKKKTRY